MEQKALLVYSGVDGQTYKITQKISELLSKKYSCELYKIHEISSVDFTSYDLIIFGAAIRYGFYNKKWQRFIADHAEILNQLNTAFFSVNLIARKLEKRTPETNSYARKFLEKTPWKPKYCEVFAGALCYSKYRWYDRLMIQLIMKMTGGETDSSVDIEYTDWQQVEDFAKKLMV